MVENLILVLVYKKEQTKDKRKLVTKFAAIIVTVIFM